MFMFIRDFLLRFPLLDSYAFHPYNAIAIDTWFDDMSDRQLEELLVFLNELADVPDVSTV